MCPEAVILVPVHPADAALSPLPPVAAPVLVFPQPVSRPCPSTDQLLDQTGN